MAMLAVRTMAAMVVLLALAVQSEEVQMLDVLDDRASGGEVVQGMDSGPPPVSTEEKRKKVHFNRQAFFHGEVDSDEASLDNGDDTNLLEIWEGMQPKHQTPASKTMPEKPGEFELGESADVTQPMDADVPRGKEDNSHSQLVNSLGETMKSDDSTTTDNSTTPTMPSLSDIANITKMDEHYMPAIMDKLIKMHDEMKTLQGANWEEILETHRDGVVQIMVVKKKFLWKAAYRSPLSEEISGSGWFIQNSEFTVDTKNELLVVTNAHVAKNAAEINILVPSLGQEPIPAEVVGLCSQRDIAILRVVDKPKLLELYKAKTGKVDIVRMALGDSDEMKRGARVMAVGYPLGLKSVKSSTGIVSGYQQFKSALYLQITAPINPGNSGGPLFNQMGQVVGINSAKIASASGMSFSISSVQLKVMLDVLYQRRQFVVPYLGYGFSVGTKLIQDYLEVDGAKEKQGGIYITKVHPNGLFNSAGVKQGDLLLTVDGAEVDRFGQTWMPTMKDNINILGLLARKQVGSDLTLGVWRKGDKQMISLTTKYDETAPFAIPFIYEPLLHKPKFHIFAGIVFMELVENLIETLLEENVAELIKYMKPENRLSPAVIIAGVLPGSLADLDGSVKKGLIVQKFNGKDVTNMNDICSGVASASGDWYTVSTSKTFTALKAEKVEEQQDTDPEISGRNGDYCALLMTTNSTSTSNVTAGGIESDGDDFSSVLSMTSDLDITRYVRVE